MKTPVISVSDISKCYRLYEKPIDRLKQAVFRERRRYFHEHWALRDISFEMYEGEIVGILDPEEATEERLGLMMTGGGN